VDRGDCERYGTRLILKGIKNIGMRRRVKKSQKENADVKAPLRSRERGRYG